MVKATLGPVFPTKPPVTLVMDYDVAVSLRELVGLVGGDPSDSYRNHSDQIRNALEDIPIQRSLIRVTRFSGSLTGAIINSKGE